MYTEWALCILWVGVKAWSLGVVMGCRIGVESWSGTLEGKFGVEQEMQVNNFLEYKETFRYGC